MSESALKTYQTPGVYVEEVDRGIKPIQAAEASLPAFIGITASASRKAQDGTVIESLLRKPTLITSWTQFGQLYGDFVDGAILPDAVYGHFMNGGGRCVIVSVHALEETAVQVIGKNGISFVLKAKGQVTDKSAISVKVDKDANGQETGTFSVTVGKKTYSKLTLDEASARFVGKVVDAYAVENVNADSFPVDGDYAAPDTGSSKVQLRDMSVALEALEKHDDVRLIACPDLMANYEGTEDDKNRIRLVQQAMVSHCQNRMRYCFAILDTPPGLIPQQAVEWRQNLNIDSSYAALYYPWIKVNDFVNGSTKLVPPSGHMVGIYNRVDDTRGVHKAPANEILQGVVDVEIHISKFDQQALNPIGVNCIRPFPNRGIRVWGARTLSNDTSWRYINVRRLFIFVEASMDAGLQWVVFEPNNRNLWARVSRDVTAFLRGVWRSGALFGNNVGEAFYVKCDDELNPVEVRDLGQLVIEVGISPVKPAEFVIFRISQWAGPNAE